MCDAWLCHVSHFDRFLFCFELLAALPKDGENAHLWRGWMEEMLSKGCDSRELLVTLVRQGIYKYDGGSDAAAAM